MFMKSSSRTGENYGFTYLASHVLMEKASMFQCFFALLFHRLFFELSCFPQVWFRHDFLIAMEARTDLAEGGRMHKNTNGCVMLPTGPLHITIHIQRRMPKTPTSRRIKLYKLTHPLPSPASYGSLPYQSRALLTRSTPSTFRMCSLCACALG